MSLTNKQKNIFLLGLVLTASLLLPAFGFCSVESSLTAIQSKLTGTILPLVSILGLVWAGMSFAIAHPNARTHFFLALIGAAVGFGSSSLIAFVRALVH